MCVCVCSVDGSGAVAGSAVGAGGRPGGGEEGGGLRTEWRRHGGATGKTAQLEGGAPKTE